MRLVLGPLRDSLSVGGWGGGGGGGRGCPIRTSFVCNAMSLNNSDEKMDDSYTSEWDFSESTSGSASEGNIWELTVYCTLHV